MATQVGGLIRNATLDARYAEGSCGVKTNVSKAQKKGGLGGRKPLGEISNSVKQPSFNPSLKKQSSMDFSYIKEENGASIGGKKGFSKPQDKAQTGVRKPLGDISNSRKPSMHQAPKKSLNKNLNVLVEEPLHFNAIAEEQFLHNHQDCIKAQRKDVDMDYFLKTIALGKDSSMQISSQIVHSIPMKIKVESPLKYMELEEMAELLLEDRPPRGCKSELLGKFKSSPPCKSPESPKLGWNWKDDKFSDFMLMDSPKLLKY